MRRFGIYVCMFPLFLLLLLSSYAQGKVTYEVFVPDKIGIFSIDNPEVVAKIVSRNEGARCMVVDIGNIVNRNYEDLDPLYQALDDLLFEANYDAKGRKKNDYNAIVGVKVYYKDGKVRAVIGTPVKIICRREVIILEREKSNK